MHRKISALLIACMACAACEKSVIKNIASEESKPVLNVLMAMDSTVYARVTLSGGINHLDTFTVAANATVKLYEDGTLLETLQPREINRRLYYCSQAIAKKGKEYRVTAEIPGFPYAEGKDFIPDTAIAVKAIIDEIEEDLWGMPLIRTTINLDIQDRPGEKNYYQVRFFTKYLGTNNQVEDSPVPLTFDTDEREPGRNGRKYLEKLFSDDRLFDGREGHFVIRLHGRGEYYALIAEVTTLTEQSFKYLRTLQLSQHQKEDGWIENVVIYNNIINGMGIVGGTSVKYYRLK